MKNVLIIFCIFSFYAISLFSSTINDYFFKLDSHLKKGKYISESEFFIVGSNGYVMYSPDNGNYWERKLTYTQEFLVSLEFVKFSKTIFVIGQNGTLLKSSNKGNNWEKININSKSNLYSISFSDNIGIITGDSGIVLISHDYGENWEMEPKFSESLLKHSIIVKDEIFIVDNSSVIYRKKIDKIEWQIENKNGEITKKESTVKIMHYKDYLLLLNNSHLLLKNDNNNEWIVRKLDTVKPANFYFFKDNILSIIFPDNAPDNYTFFSALNLNLIDPKSELVSFYPNFAQEYIISTSYCEDIFSDENHNNLFAIGMNGTIFKFDNLANIWKLLSHQGSSNPYSFKLNFFFNDSVGVYGKYNSVVFRTRNKGNTFITQKIEDESKGDVITGFLFQSKNTFLRLLNNSNYPISETSNGGESFEQINYQSGISKQKIAINNNMMIISGYFEKPNSSYGSTYYGQIKIVENYENTLTYQIFDSCLLMKPVILKSNEFLVCGFKQIREIVLDSNGKVIDKGLNKGLILRSTDYGNVWDSDIYDEFTQISNLSFIDSSNGFAFAEYALNDMLKYRCLLRTVDSGNTWLKVLDSIVYYLSDIYINSITGYGLLLGNRGLIWETYDFGCTWKLLIDEETKEQLETFVNLSYMENELYISTSTHMYRAYPGKFPPNIVSVKSEVDGGAPPIWLYPPFPNPTKSDINFKLLWSKHITLENVKFGLYDILGNQVENFPNISAVYELENLASINLTVQTKLNGLYYLRANVDGYYKTYPIVFE